MKTLETTRLVIRPLMMNDLESVHQLLDQELKDANIGTDGQLSLEQRERWLQWTILGYEQFSKLCQPPYGERAVILKDTHQLIGLCGFVPCLDHFEQLNDRSPSFATTEFGLFYAISKNFQGFGFATEAAFAMTTYAFDTLHVKRLIATTTNDNLASIQVMRKLGMQLKHNPLPSPAWLQVVGLLNNPSSAKTLKSIAEEYAERIWNQKDLTAISDLLNPQIVIHSLLGDYHGHRPMEDVVNVWLKGFPDLTVKNHSTICEQDLVVIQWRAKGTHQGEFKGIPPSHRPVSYEGVTHYRIKDNKITEYWAYLDMQHLLNQIA